MYLTDFHVDKFYAQTFPTGQLTPARGRKDACWVRGIFKPYNNLTNWHMYCTYDTILTTLCIDVLYTIEMKLEVLCTVQLLNSLVVKVLLEEGKQHQLERERKIQGR